MLSRYIPSGGSRISQAGWPTPESMKETPIIWQEFCRKLRENERNLTKGGEGVPSSSLRSANDDSCIKVDKELQFLPSMTQLLQIVLQRFLQARLFSSRNIPKSLCLINAFVSQIKYFFQSFRDTVK